MNTNEDIRRTSAEKQDNGRELTEEQLDAATGGLMVMFEGESAGKGAKLKYYCKSCLKEIIRVVGEDELSDFTCNCGKNDWEARGYAD